MIIVIRISAPEISRPLNFASRMGFQERSLFQLYSRQMQELSDSILALSSFRRRSFSPVIHFGHPLFMPFAFSDHSSFGFTPNLLINRGSQPMMGRTPESRRPSSVQINPRRQSTEAPRRFLSQEEQIRRDYGIPEGEDLYGGYVQRQNEARHQQAQRTNQDGGAYLSSVIDQHVASLPEKEQKEFKAKIEEADPELFIEVPRLAVKKALTSPAPLTKENTPNFMHKHIDKLEELRKKQKQITAEEAWKQACEIATQLAREADCIASMQKAFEKQA